MSFARTGGFPTANAGGGQVEGRGACFAFVVRTAPRRSAILFPMNAVTSPSSPCSVSLGRMFTLWSALGFVFGCGTGETYGVAPGPSLVVDGATPVTDGGETMGDAGSDAGPVADAGPGVDAGENCFVEEGERRDLTAEEDLAAFVDTGVRAEFSCAACHRNKNPSGSGIGWGASADTDQGWFEAAVALVERDGQVDPTETRLYAAFSGTISSQHPLDAVAQAAVVTWLDARAAGVTTPGEVVCIDAGPAEEPPTNVDPADPPPQQGCTPILPSQAESLARFEELAIASKLTGCASCHASASKSATGANTSWGASASPPSASDWHAAFYGKAMSEGLGADVQSSSLYRHVSGTGVHFVSGAPELVEQWLEYVILGEPPAGCP